MATEIFRKDYRALPITVESLHLNFQLGEEYTTVCAKMHLKLVTGKGLSDLPSGGLFLNGRNDVKLIYVHVDGRSVPENEYTLQSHGLCLHEAALSPLGADHRCCHIETVVHIRPQDNTLLEGLYKSSGNFSTQCEAEGFRGITYFFDRPDILTTYTVRIEAEKEKYPTLLSNGNLTEQGELANGYHYAVWVDPFPKPCYLFALVAGQFLCKEDTFRTCSGKDVCLRIYVQKGPNIEKVDHALESLKRAMRWDEVRFGREYDLSLFNIVAVDDFNMGAMENKSLNIFNSKAVLATSATATDGDFQRIEGIVGHEYFHNWTGNRVTCRDWFQLTLKEGLTVYRDQEFSSDMNSRDAYRLGVVSTVRSAQFPQDQGPMAHSIRPDSYIKMDNFYTLTVYRKGAEIIRMYETVLGREGFRKGMDLYFERHDGQAVTCDDFLKAMEDANGADLSSLALWYSQAGTPSVVLRIKQDREAKTFTIEAEQSTPPTPGQPTKVPVLIPIRVSLLRQCDGQPLPLKLQGTNNTGSTECVLHLTQPKQSFVFESVEVTCVASVMRGFSAPVKYTIVDQTEQDLSFLLKNDTDGYNRYEASQRLSQSIILRVYEKIKSAKQSGRSISDALAELSPSETAAPLVQAFQFVLRDSAIDNHLKAHLLSFPSHSELISQIKDCDPPLLHYAIKFLHKAIAEGIRLQLEAILREVGPASKEYKYTPQEIAKREIVNKCYSFLSSLGGVEIEITLLQRQLNATNMTDEMAALSALNTSNDARTIALAEFYKKWCDDPLVLLKWMTLHATAEIEGNLTTVKNLMDNTSVFNIRNPNSCYALVGAFTSSLVNFHAENGSGYEFLAECVVKIDQVNHQVAAKLAASFDILKQLDSKRQDIIRSCLQKISATNGVSDNVKEIVLKTLNC